MTLGEQQEKFARLVPRLIDKALELGFQVRLGEVERPQRMAEWYASRGLGTRNSLHISRLAIDLHLFQRGTYLSDTESHRELGEWWKQQDPDARWGGDFRGVNGKPKPDGNHYSLAWEGRA